MLTSKIIPKKVFPQKSWGKIRVSWIASKHAATQGSLTENWTYISIKDIHDVNCKKKICRECVLLINMKNTLNHILPLYILKKIKESIFFKSVIFNRRW